MAQNGWIELFQNSCDYIQRWT